MLTCAVVAMEDAILHVVAMFLQASAVIAFRSQTCAERSNLKL